MSVDTTPRSRKKTYKSDGIIDLDKFFKNLMFVEFLISISVVVLAACGGESEQGSIGHQDT